MQIFNTLYKIILNTASEKLITHCIDNLLREQIPLLIQTLRSLNFQIDPEEPD